MASSFTWEGVTYPSQQAAAAALGVSRHVIVKRAQRGQHCEADLRKPYRRRPVIRGVVYDSVPHAHRETGIPRHHIYTLMDRGLIDEEPYEYKRTL